MTVKAKAAMMHDEAMEALDDKAFRWHRNKDKKTDAQRMAYHERCLGAAGAYRTIDLITDEEYDAFVANFEEGAEYNPLWYGILTED